MYLMSFKFLIGFVIILLNSIQPNYHRLILKFYLEGF